MKRIFLIPIFLLMFAAPAFADVEFTITSEPMGATITSGGNTLGTTPYVVKVKTKGGKNEQCFYPDAIRVTWPSGASASTSGVYRICESAGKKQTLGFSRPTGAPGSELDFQYALQLQQLEMMRQQMALQAYLNLRAQQRADQQALYLQQQQNMYNLMQSLAAIRPKQLQVNCTSQLVGNFVYTNCR